MAHLLGASNFDLPVSKVATAADADASPSGFAFASPGPGAPVPQSVNSDISIRLDSDITDPQVVAFLEAHLDHMRSLFPAESVHALDLSGLRQPCVRFFTAWRGDTLLGTGALKDLDYPTTSATSVAAFLSLTGGVRKHGELKSMRTAPAARRQGVASAILRHILEYARASGFGRISLESGNLLTAVRCSACVCV
jgi:putative acetyltransferase